MNEKTELRRQMRQEIAELPEDYIISSNSEITKKLLDMSEYKSASRVFAYYSVGRECDTRAIITATLNESRTVALPRVHGQGVMDFSEYTEQLVPGSLKIPEPPADSEVLIPDERDIIIVPALCCDETLQRLGQGGGYYDRFLPKVSALKVALCREALLQKKLPKEWNDFPVDIVITEARVIRAK